MVAADWPLDIILLDVMMPGMDGPTTLARLRDNAQTAEIPVVFMTARAQTRELELFRSLGAVGVIPKPFDPMTLAASVRSYVRPTNGQFDALRNVFLQRLHDDAAALVRHRSLLKDDATAMDALAGIKSIAHGLAGAAGVFGFSKISDVAAQLEEAVILDLNGPGNVDGTASALDDLLDSVDACSTIRKEPPRPRLNS